MIIKLAQHQRYSAFFKCLNKQHAPYSVSAVFRSSIKAAILWVSTNNYWPKTCGLCDEIKSSTCFSFTSRAPFSTAAFYWKHCTAKYIALSRFCYKKAKTLLINRPKSCLKILLSCSNTFKITCLASTSLPGPFPSRAGGVEGGASTRREKHWKRSWG